MKDKETNHAGNVDAAVDSIRADRPSKADMAAATERVRALITSHEETASDIQLNSIEDYIAAIPDYLGNQLTPAQTLLFEEESRRNVPLRRALEAARRPADQPLDRDTQKQPLLRWFASAAVIATIAISVLFILPELPSLDQSRLVQVESIYGDLYQVADGKLNGLTTGVWIDGRRVVRTAKDSSAILVLDDGSRVEVNGRSELSVTRRASGNRIEVERGRIIVIASPQGSGTLDVATDEFVVSVTGTIFEVGHGAMGSRVAVIEGEVEVRQQGDSRSLTPGEQMSSRSGFSTMQIGDEIAWSRDADRYIEMLREVSELQREIGAVMETEPRYSTRLLDLAPENTAVYIAVPNAPEKIAEVYQLLRSRMQQEDALAEVWANIETGSDDQHLDEVMDWLSQIGDDLGDETVAALSLQATDEGSRVVPVVLSEVDAVAFASTFDAHVQELHEAWTNEGQQGDLTISLIDDPADAVSGQLSIWLSGDLLVASIDAAVMQEMGTVLESEKSKFVGSDFHGLLANAYGDGAEFLGAVHLAGILSSTEPRSELNGLGLDNAQFLIAERRQQGDRATVAAELKFDGERTGMMSWLAAPAPMGALEFFSVDASLAAALVVKDPSVLMDEFEQLIHRNSDSRDDSDHADVGFELDLRSDVIATLGGEAAVGLDGPVLPTPSWKAVIEVYDELRLQESIEYAIDHLNQRSTDDGVSLLISSADVDGYTGYRINIAARDGSAVPMQGIASVHYAFVDGYLVAAPNDALVDKAIGYYRSGGGILTDDEFRRLLPQGDQLDFSAVTFSRISGLIADVIETMPSAFSAEQQEMVKELSRGPSMVTVYASPDSMRFVQNGSSELPFSISQLFSLQAVIGAATDQTPSSGTLDKGTANDD